MNSRSSLLEVIELMIMRWTWMLLPKEAKEEEEAEEAETLLPRPPASKASATHVAGTAIEGVTAGLGQRRAAIGKAVGLEDQVLVPAKAAAAAPAALAREKAKASFRLPRDLLGRTARKAKERRPSKGRKAKERKPTKAKRVKEDMGDR